MTQNFSQLIAKVKKDVLDFASEVEMAYNRSCHSSITDVVANCTRNNYDSCVSEFPSPRCYKSVQYFNVNCSNSINDTTCGALIDENVSNVILPFRVANGPNGNPTDTLVS